MPVFVVDNRWWIGDNKFEKCTSAPYFDEKLCGVKYPPDGSSYPEQAFKRFKDPGNLASYHPREFVEAGYTYLHSTRAFLDCVRKAYAI